MKNTYIFIFEHVEHIKNTLITCEKHMKNTCFIYVCFKHVFHMKNTYFLIVLICFIHDKLMFV